MSGLRRKLKEEYENYKSLSGHKRKKDLPYSVQLSYKILDGVESEEELLYYQIEGLLLYNNVDFIPQEEIKNLIQEILSTPNSFVRSIWLQTKINYPKNQSYALLKLYDSIKCLVIVKDYLSLNQVLRLFTDLLIDNDTNINENILLHVMNAITTSKQHCSNWDKFVIEFRKFLLELYSEDYTNTLINSQLKIE